MSERFNSLPGMSCVPADGSMYLLPKIDMPQKAIEEAKKRGKEADVMYSLDMLGECACGSGGGVSGGRFSLWSGVLWGDEVVYCCFMPVSYLLPVHSVYPTLRLRAQSHLLCKRQCQLLIHHFHSTRDQPTRFHAPFHPSPHPLTRAYTRCYGNLRRRRLRLRTSTRNVPYPSDCSVSRCGRLRGQNREVPCGLYEKVGIGYWRLFSMPWL
jgi:hypothetical protein